MTYRIIRSNRRSLCAQIREGQLVVRAPKEASQGEIERFLLKHKDWIEAHLTKAQEQKRALEHCPKLTPEEVRALRAKAKKVIPERVAYYAPLIGVTYGKITIRMQRSRWGSCTANGNLSFNALLMLAPLSVLDSIVVHELCHRKQMNHSRRFYEEVLRVYPAYRQERRWLTKNGHLLFASVSK
ncbi:MAG TPA: metal-dependent hydrolase [Clostridiales bacterium]|nr:metal-dependent hydrolase [Clostridiales bacterium]